MFYVFIAIAGKNQATRFLNGAPHQNATLQAAIKIALIPNDPAIQFRYQVEVHRERCGYTLHHIVDRRRRQYKRDDRVQNH
ncbi:hypothetical protein BK673_23280 [Pseudomonas fluorescens]|jgi:hypothetical protein|uniref:Uncharacterized protein n=1 Tax=Pseudomonas fluorescens TaxID=294 RepID=A0A423P051_PSEFL|nr:hypothetical protein BOW65_03930 [Pseudomonas koreensis]ROO04096.1 hypothetical protein BK673_23280 [Pseudomonas fluorescens]